MGRKASHYFLYSKHSKERVALYKAERKNAMKKIFDVDFHLFDGEGAGAVAGGEATTASTPESKQDVKKTEYGKSRGEEQAPSQVGTDMSQGGSLDEEFASLIGKGGRFHDLYGQAVSSAIQDRFKNQADLQGQVDAISNGLSPLFMNYGLDSGDFEGLINAVNNDDAFYQAGAERAGLDIDQYKRNLQLQAEAERGRRITEAYEQEQMKQQMFAAWEEQATQLQSAFPGFDLAMEIEHNEAFANLLNNGVDVHTAFVSTHLNEIMQGNNAEAQTKATKDVVNTIQSRASRPIENGMNHAAAIQRKSDPSKLTDEDLDEINRRVANGEAVSF